MTSAPAHAGISEIDLFAIALPDGRLRDISEAFATLLGITPSEGNGRRLTEFVYPDDREDLADQIKTLAVESEPQFECRFVQSNGQAVYVQWVARRVSGEHDLWRAAGTDTADLVKLLVERRDLKTRLDLAVGQAIVAMWELDIAEGRFTWEPQAATILGIEIDALPTSAAALTATVNPADSEALESALTRLIDQGRTDIGLRVGHDAGLRHLSLRGRVLAPGRARTPDRAVGLLLDITTEKAMEEQLLRMSVSDGLTGAPNRRAFDQALKGESRRCARAEQPLTILMADIDHFKEFNDTFGHIVGDQALISVARALAAALPRAEDALARYGGEEFAAVLPGMNVLLAQQTAERLAQAVRQVKLRQAPQWSLTVSVGTATWLPGHDKIKPGTLLKKADQALYAAKRAGRDRVFAHEHPGPDVALPVAIGDVQGRDLGCVRAGLQRQAASDSARPRAFTPD